MVETFVMSSVFANQLLQIIAKELVYNNCLIPRKAQKEFLEYAGAKVISVDELPESLRERFNKKK